jgi:hypothetical protein
MIVRNHLLCPHSSCVAHERKDENRIRALIDEKRNVTLEQSSKDKKTMTKLPYLNKKWIVRKTCPFCYRDVEVVIDETHDGRNISLRLP